MFWRGVCVDSVCPLIDGDNVATLLVGIGRLTGLVNKSATCQAGNLCKVEKDRKVNLKFELTFQGKVLINYVVPTSRIFLAGLR